MRTVSAYYGSRPYRLPSDPVFCWDEIFQPLFAQLHDYIGLVISSSIYAVLFVQSMQFPSSPNNFVEAEKFFFYTDRFNTAATMISYLFGIWQN